MLYWLIGSYLVLAVFFTVRDFVRVRDTVFWQVSKDDPFVVGYMVVGNLLFWWVNLIYALVHTGLNFLVMRAANRRKES